MLQSNTAPFQVSFGVEKADIIKSFHSQLLNVGNAQLLLVLWQEYSIPASSNVRKAANIKKNFSFKIYTIVL